MLKVLSDLVLLWESLMAGADTTSNRYDPWYVKVAFGVFVSLVVGVLVVLHGAPNYIVH